MRQIIIPALAAALLASPALAQVKMSWVSAPVFIGQTTKPDGTKHVTYLAAIQSITPNAQGQYELFVQTKPYYQESYADHKAIKMRALCNANASNACVLGQPGWHQMLLTYTNGAQ